MAWVWRLGWFGLIGFRDLSSLSLFLGVNRPLLPVVVRFTISSFPELVDLFGSRENEVKVWIFDYIFFSASKLVWFFFWFRIKWGKIKDLDFWFDLCVVFGFQMFCCDLVWLAKNCGIWVQWCWICSREIKRMKIKKKKKKKWFFFLNLINYFFKLRNKDFFFLLLMWLF